MIKFLEFQDHPSILYFFSPSEESTRVPARTLLEEGGTSCQKEDSIELKPNASLFYLSFSYSGTASY